MGEVKTVEAHYHDWMEQEVVRLTARVAEREALLREARAALDPDEDGRLCRDIEEATGWGK